MIYRGTRVYNFHTAIWYQFFCVLQYIITLTNFFVNKYWTYPAFQIFPIYDIIWEQVEDSLGLEFCFMYMYKLIYSEWVCNYFQQLKLRYIYILICILIDKGALFNIQVHFDIGRNIAFKMWCDKEKIYVMYVRTRNAWEMVNVGLFKVTVCFI